VNGALTRRSTGLGDTAANMIEVVNPRGEEAGRAGFRVGVQPSNRRVDVGASDHEPLGTTRQDDARAALVVRTTRSTYTLDRQIELMERASCIASGVFNGEPGYAGGRSELHGVCNVLRIDREPALSPGRLSRPVGSFRHNEQHVP
jgi:hypothetical protein